MLKIYGSEKKENFIKLSDFGNNKIVVHIVDTDGCPKYQGNLLTIDRTSGHIQFCRNISPEFRLDLNQYGRLQRKGE